MFNTIGEQFRAEKKDRAERAFLTESVLGVEEVLPGSEDEMEDAVDVDSVPQEVYAKLDAELDKIVDDPDYDDTEADEMIDDDDFSDDEIEAVINEACDAWEDDENIGHPQTKRRSNNVYQPIFKPSGQGSL